MKLSISATECIHLVFYSWVALLNQLDIYIIFGFFLKPHRFKIPMSLNLGFMVIKIFSNKIIKRRVINAPRCYLKHET